MLNIRLAAALILSASTLLAQSAVAFETDDRSMNSPSQSSNYTDPDDKSPMPGLSFGSESGNNSDPAGFRSSFISPAGNSDSARAPTMSPFDRNPGQ